MHVKAAACWLSPLWLISAWSYVVHMPKTHQALVEYEGMVGSSAAVNAAISQFYVADHRTYIDYSTKQKLSRGGDSENHRNITKVLLLTFTNSITTVYVSICISTFFQWYSFIQVLLCEPAVKRKEKPLFGSVRLPKNCKMSFFCNEYVDFFTTIGRNIAKKI